MISRPIYACALCLVAMGCTPTAGVAQEREDASSAQPGKSSRSSTAPKASDQVRETPPIKEIAPLDQSKLPERYPWLAYTDNLPELTTLDRAIEAPEGYTRQEVDKDSYASYLRGLPLRTDRKNVLLYNGEEVWMPSAGIIPLDLGSRDLHQCADSVIRLYSEYLWSVSRAEEAQFHYTSGDLARWKDWRAGKVLQVKGNKVVQVSSKKSPDTHEAYRSWLDRVFMYASTRSLHRDSKRVNKSRDLQAGDFFLQGGSPGHVVMILDIASKPDGARVALLGQGFLPAREFHVISGEGEHVVDGAWYVLLDGVSLDTPTWRPFGMDDAWRFK